MNDFTDKVVLITGAGRGIGRALAQAFAIQGAWVAANDISPINLDETVASVRAAGGTIRDYVFDAAKRMPIREMLDQILDEWGRLDILINNAAVEPHASILDMDEWDWQRTLDVNLSGPFYTIQQVGRVMRDQGGGVIVNVGASEGRAGGLPERAAYIASKQGLLGLTREAARELAPYNIRVNAVCPGLVRTGKAGELLPEGAAPGSIHRIGHPDEVASLILFLCSPASAHVAGQSINIDGGWLMS
jgi:NAD(P)-dependent dehydrogenase (short-subunit alcohol dehydrogenase family)